VSGPPSCGLVAWTMSGAQRGPVAGALARKSDAARGARSLAARAPSDATVPDWTSEH
jgi:hypothetical protein